IRFYNPTGGQVVIDNVMWNSRYDIPEGEQTTIEGITLTLTGGSANSVVGNLASFPAFNNGSFTPLQSIFLTMSGGGPWNFDIVTVAPWGAYCYLGIWHAVENSGGHIIFTVDPDKAFVFPIVLGDEDPTLPVELSTFTVSLNSFNNAVLNWITQTETGVSGFYVYRNNSENLASAILVSNLIPATNSSEEHSYSFTDKELFSHGTYYYWLQVADIDGSESYHGPATLVYTGDNEPALPSIPTVTELRSIFPNPFNPNTNLSYSLAEEAEVSVKIYNARGQLVRTLNEGRKAVGHHSAAWDGKDDRGQNQSTGVYFFRMQAGKKVFNSKAVLMK
ncbi:MAG: FlgD immunoglobulin-like domain containing protein, partial [Syntrophaceticus schinkii]|nr:FlgD immunoglobulin-like domain containing protein [Syntrophaceticus schinkii]